MMPSLQELSFPTVTPHITDCLHTRAHQPTLGTRADPVPIQHTNQVRKLCINVQYVPGDLKTRLQDKQESE